MKNFLILLFFFLIGSALITKQPPVRSQYQKEYRQLYTDTLVSIDIDSLQKQIDKEIDSIAYSLNKKREYEKKLYILKRKNIELKKQLEEYKRVVEFYTLK